MTVNICEGSSCYQTTLISFFMRLQVLLAMVIAKTWYYSDLYKVFDLLSRNMVINKGAP